MSKLPWMLLFFAGPVLYAQTDFTIRGIVKDQSDNPVPYALITQLNTNDSSILRTNFPDSAGHYLIRTQRIAHTTLTVSALGFETKAYAFSEKENLRYDAAKREIVLDVNLLPAENQLEEIVVSDTRPLFEQKIDRMVFNVANSIAAAGGDALEMLRKAPGVIVDPLSNSIRLAGKSGLGIMVNGRLLRLSGDDLLAYLRTIPADHIERIEVITTPPAKYDASGSSGLIDIILKKNPKAGLNGRLHAGYEQASYGKIMGGGNVNYRKKRWNIYGNMNYSKAKNQITERLNTPYATNILNLEDAHLRTLQPLSYRLGSDYELHKNGVIGLLFQGNNFWRSDEDNITNRVLSLPERTVDSLMHTLGDSRQSRNNYSLNLNYEWRLDTSGKKLSFNANQFWFGAGSQKTFETKNYLGTFLAPTGVESKNRIGGTQDVQIATAQIDMELPYKWASLSFGGKMSFIHHRSSNQFQFFEGNQFVNNPDISNTFDYSENIQAIYGSAQREMGKWGFQAGLRGEFTQTRGYSLSLNQTHTNQYFQVFPTGYMQYKLNKLNTLNLNYSKRINRPGYSQLDPFRSYSSPYFYSEGNPFLQPYFSHNLEVRYSYKYRYFFTAFYQLANNSIDQIWLTDAATQVTSSQVGNYFKTRSFGLSAMASFQPASWWEVQTQASFSYQQLSSDYYPEFVRSTVPYFYIYLNSSVAFNASKTFLAEMNSYYSGKSQMGFFEWAPAYSLNLGIKRLFFDKKLTLSVHVRDVFNSLNNRKARNIYSGQTMRNDLDLRNIRFTASYTFGNAKLKSARTRKTGIEDEKGRM